MKSVTLDSLPPLSRQLAEDSLAWMEPYGDDATDLLCYPGKRGHYSALDLSEEPHIVRESAWWAIGLLLRNRQNDAKRAGQILEAVLRWQFKEPGTPYHGTFHRAPEEKLPPKKGAVMWQDYDPNWRQFIGTSFLVILEKLADRVSPELRSSLRDSLRLAVEGETPGRIDPGYSNIAMMHAVMLVQVGEILGEPAWKKQGIALARAVYDLFAEEETFAEYNSPTYYGVILYGLRLWRLESSGAELQEWGAKMAAALWRHIGDFYHPRLRNICGPFDRAYGMDMTKYVAGIGTWMRLELPPEIAPAPLLTDDFEHRHDLTIAPLVALLGTEIPGDVRARLKEFQKERLITQVIEKRPALRTATACLKADLMWGAESGSKACGWAQFHAATVHWLQPDGSIGWMRLENEMWVDAVADEKGLQVTATNGDEPARMIWHFSANARPEVSPTEWRLPGMVMHVATDLPTPTSVEGSHDLHTLTYELKPSQKASLHLEFQAA